MSLRLISTLVGTALLGAIACTNSELTWGEPSSSASATSGAAAVQGGSSSMSGGVAPGGALGRGAEAGRGGSAVSEGEAATGGAAPATPTGADAGGAPAPSESADGGVDSVGGDSGAPETCPQGCCAPDSAESALADSQQGFSETQGKCGWSYGYLPAGSEPFTPLTHFVASPTPVWRVSLTPPPWSSIYRDKQHPNQTPLQWIARRWTSSVRGTLSVKGHVAKGDVGGDGIIAQVRADGVPLWEERVDDSAARDFELQVSAVPGTTIDFVVAPGSGGDGHDTTAFTATISW